MITFKGSFGTFGNSPNCVHPDVHGQTGGEITNDPLVAGLISMRGAAVQQLDPKHCRTLRRLAFTFDYRIQCQFAYRV